MIYNVIVIHDCLLYQVNMMMNSPHFIDTKCRQIIVETAQILLKAGACPNVPSDHEPLGPLEILLAPLYTEWSVVPRGYLIPVYFKNLLKLEELPYVCAVNSYFKLVAELTKLLLISRADPSRSPLYIIAMSVAAEVVEIRKILGENFGRLDPYDEIVDSCGNIFGYLMLAGADRFTDTYWDQISIDIEHGSAFICIAGDASRSGRSKNLTRMILGALGATNINKLRFEARNIFQQAMGAYNPENVSYYIDTAMRWIQCVQLPPSLKDIACRVINRAMSSRCLLETSSPEKPHLDSLQELACREINRTTSNRSLRGVSSLEIPCHLMPYILLQSFDEPIGGGGEGGVRLM